MPHFDTTKVEISIAMAKAGGKAIEEFMADKLEMAKQNWMANLAARVFERMATYLSQGDDR
jgi:hypothetical protein